MQHPCDDVDAPIYMGETGAAAVVSRTRKRACGEIPIKRIVFSKIERRSYGADALCDDWKSQGRAFLLGVARFTIVPGCFIAFRFKTLRESYFFFSFYSTDF